MERVDAFQGESARQNGGILGCPFGNLGQEMARQDERIREALQKIFDAHCAYIEAALVRAQQAGEIPAGDNRQRARNIFALFEGALLMAKVSNDPQPFRRVVGAVKAVAAA
jgi:TetR/AcrR family transcriptional repressor of nem operon